jgi:ferritin-like metal-binding protein YciE
MAASSNQEQLVKYLADAHSIEEQALTQMRAAPGLAGDAGLARAFEAHLIETERHERIVRERLEAHGANPSRSKDLAGKAGGWGMLLFAKSQPDTPGKLAAHAFSYEHMEMATYELLRRAALAAGDPETAAAAAEIGAEEKRMGERLEGLFDAAVEASLRELEPDDLGEQLNDYLSDAHAIEQQAIQLLQAGPKLVDDDELANLFRTHLEETRGHARLVAQRLEARGTSPSKVKDIALRMGGLNIGAFFGAQPDTTAKLSGFAFAFEHLEIGAYELLRRVAARAGDEEVVALAETILADEHAAAGKIAATWDRTMRSEMDVDEAAGRN